LEEMSRTIHRKREKSIQALLRAHPYLLDSELTGCRGRIERKIGEGRLDIDFQTEKGWIVVECKCSALNNRHVDQLCRYLDSLTNAGTPVYKAYLVGKSPRTELNQEFLNHPPGIILKYLFRDIPTFLAFSEGRHYFDADLAICPYDGTSRIAGKELSLE
jgi:hypothetical protein